MTVHGAHPDAAPGARPVYKSPWLWAAVFGVVVLTGLKTCSGRRLTELPRLAAVPAFTLVDQAGQRFGSAELAGKVWVASFIFTTCSTVCPRISDANADLQRRLADAGPAAANVRLVSFTVDPEMDRPPLLAAYADKYGADPARWTFLTTADGATAPLYDLVAKGFQLAMGERQPDSAGVVDISHSSKLVLVDATGTIRNYFGADDDERALIVAYAKELAAEAAEAARQSAGGAR